MAKCSYLHNALWSATFYIAHHRLNCDLYSSKFQANTKYLNVLMTMNT